MSGMDSATTATAARQSTEPGARVPLESGSLREQSAALFSEHGRYVWRVLRRMGVAERDLEDVCQDVFLTVHRKLAEFEARSSTRTWIYGICLRLAANYRRCARHRHEQPAAMLPEHASAAAGDPPGTLSDIDRALAQLSTRKREVFVLYEFGELTMAEVAEVVGCPVKTCYSRLHAAREELRAFLARSEESP